MDANSNWTIVHHPLPNNLTRLPLHIIQECVPLPNDETSAVKLIFHISNDLVQGQLINFLLWRFLSRRVGKHFIHHRRLEKLAFCTQEAQNNPD